MCHRVSLWFTATSSCGGRQHALCPHQLPWKHSIRCRDTGPERGASSDECPEQRGRHRSPRARSPVSDWMSPWPLPFHQCTSTLSMLACHSSVPCSALLCACDESGTAASVDPSSMFTPQSNSFKHPHNPGIAPSSGGAGRKKEGAEPAWGPAQDVRLQRACHRPDHPTLPLPFLSPRWEALPSPSHLLSRGHLHGSLSYHTRLSSIH